MNISIFCYLPSITDNTYIFLICTIYTPEIYNVYVYLRLIKCDQISWHTLRKMNLFLKIKFEKKNKHLIMKMISINLNWRNDAKINKWITATELALIANKNVIQWTTFIHTKLKIDLLCVQSVPNFLHCKFASKFFL